MKYNFLLEIGTEELPSKNIKILTKIFINKLLSEFKKNNLIYKKKLFFLTPRRIGLILTELYQIFNKKNKYIKGPSIINAIDKNGNFTLITNLWIKKYNIDKKKIKYIQNKKGKWLLYKKKKIKIKKIIKYIIKKTLLQLKIIKIMKWGTCKNSFIRPVNNIIILLNEKKIKKKIYSIKSNNITYGNPYITKHKIKIKHPSQYSEKLFKIGKVINNFKNRKNKIKNDAIYLSKKKNGFIKIKKKLLEEITSLTEWPKVCIAKFKKKFLCLPKKIIIYTIEKYQKCLPIYNKFKKIMSKFIFISNINPKKMKKIILGNEKVINARLNDAIFFYKKDIKLKLEKNYFKLKKIIFYKNLGNILEKTKRIQSLIIIISKKNNINFKKAIRAAYLSKCDLASNLVNEFPETQGIIGMHYANKNKEPKKICKAIKEQYYPRFSKDKLPSNKLSCALSIADRIDNLTGVFIINQKKKKNKNDPFFLRRTVLGLIKIIINKKIKINLNKIIKYCIKNYKNYFYINQKKIIKKIKIFIKNKLLEHYKNLNYNIKIIKSILYLKKKNILEKNKLILIMNKIKKSKKYLLLIKTYKRIKNILKKNKLINKKINLLFIKKKEEKKIIYITFKIKKKIKNLIKKKKYKNGILKLLNFIKPINIFFKIIKINKKNIFKKNNRLLILKNIKKIFLKIINFNYLI
ncbi:glycine--tRNA ligase subunit beta [Buchnera aphidicola]|uniref:glycine--tRNA ligase subunit beta n=1 Tax=Buchnera aphidicola TaxID=9 RepID=UPI0031B812D9